MTTFRVWAPEAELAEVVVSGVRYPMRIDPGARAGGWWVAELQGAGHGTDYGFLLDGAGRAPEPPPDLPPDLPPDPLPDPRSPWQPYGVHGLSRVYEHDRFGWTDGTWHGMPLAGRVLYELHIGTFTPEGTFDAAIGRLDHLVDLGVDAVELLPVAAFPGRHGWGYDGVHLWAAHEPYGGPDGLKRLVDACHGRGLAVVLDVVYNHLGPSGNYLGRFGPYFTSAHHTPWGPAINFDQSGADEVRAFVVENALMWLRDFHIDGLRLDAVHAIADAQAVHILEELAAEAAALGARLGRELFLVAESDLNDPRLVTAREAGGYGLDAHWNDDFHHALHSVLTGERQAYYRDFHELPAIAKTLTGAYFHDGTLSTFRGRRHGRPVDRDRVPGHRFVGFLQNHDQVGNRAVGDRLSATLTPGQLKIGAALLLTSPFTPMLFMGEEWGAATPWCYFTDHVDPEIAAAVRVGRRAEFVRHGWSEDEVPDPQDHSTVLGSVLDWSEPERDPHRELLGWYRALIALRREHPELMDARLAHVRVTCSPGAGPERWLVVRRGACRVVANLGDEPVMVPADVLGGECFRSLLASDPRVRLGGEGMFLPPVAVAVAVARRADAG